MSPRSQRIAATAFALGAAVLLPHIVRAQRADPVGASQRSGLSIGASAGLVVPTGDVGNWLNSGYDVNVNVGVRSAGSPLGLRLEGMYQELGYNDASGLSGATHRVVAGIANGTYDLSAGSSGNLYLIGGVGLYGTSDRDSYGSLDNQTYTNLGVNGGVGYRFPLSGMDAFAEARYHYVTGTNSATGGSETLIPITFGISF